MMVQGFKRSGLWSFAIALVMAAQLAFSFHHLEHKFDLNAPTDECALCHGISTAAPPSEAALVVAPVGYEPAPVAAPVSIFAYSLSVAGFRARAPPLSVSV